MGCFCTYIHVNQHCYELIRGSRQLWIYSRKIRECARVHVNLQNHKTCELLYLVSHDAHIYYEVVIGPAASSAN